MSSQSISPQPQCDLLKVASRVYLASPMTTYKTKRYDRMLERAQKYSPGATILPARGLFKSNTDWLRKWPAILPTIDAVYVFTDKGWIGRGVWVEVQDAIKASVPVYVLTDARLYPWESVAIMERRPKDWRQHVKLRLDRRAKGGT